MNIDEGSLYQIENVSNKEMMKRGERNEGRRGKIVELEKGGDSEQAGQEWGGEDTGEEGSFLSSLTVCANSRTSAPGSTARRKCWTDELAHGAVTWI